MGDLSEHFSLSEFTISQTAERYGIDNTPPAIVIERLTDLCKTILEPARTQLGALRISSGYRCDALNKRVGGSPSSAHVLGYAADVVPLAVSKKTLARWVKTNCRFDQVILEFGAKSMEGEPSWIHISSDPRFRGQTLRIFTGSGGYQPINL
jgi:zinc D-Ala-D-Ala carboxypeptidase